MTDRSVSTPEWRLTREGIEAFRKEQHIPPMPFDEPWIEEANNTLKAICDIALASLSAIEAPYKKAWEEWRSLQTGDAQKMMGAALRYAWLRENGSKGVYVIQRWKQGDEHSPLALAQGDELDTIIDEHLEGKR